MIKSVTVTSPFSEKPLVMELKSPEKSGFFIKSIDGLGPVKATINTSEYASADGSRFNSARLPQRNIVMNLGFLWKPTIQDVRHESYVYFPVKKNVDLIVTITRRNKTGTALENFEYHTSCIVESNEPDIFSQEEGCQVSLICTDPYLYSNRHSKVIIGYEDAFSFPFSNQIGSDSIIFGNLIASSDRIISYEGNIETGIIAIINVRENISWLQLYNQATDEAMRLEPENGFLIGDEVTISTILGKKYISLKRNGVVTNIINSMKSVNNRPLSWISLIRGDNNIEISSSASTIEAALMLTIYYYDLFEGI